MNWRERPYGVMAIRMIVERASADDTAYAGCGFMALSRHGTRAGGSEACDITGLEFFFLIPLNETDGSGSEIRKVRIARVYLSLLKYRCADL